MEAKASKDANLHHSGVVIADSLREAGDYLRPCGGCSRVEERQEQFSLCGGCKSLVYCSKDCQVCFVRAYSMFALIWFGIPHTRCTPLLSDATLAQGGAQALLQTAGAEIARTECSLTRYKTQVAGSLLPQSELGIPGPPSRQSMVVRTETSLEQLRHFPRFHVATMLHPLVFVRLLLGRLCDDTPQSPCRLPSSRRRRQNAKRCRRRRSCWGR